MSENLVLLGIVATASSGLAGLCFGRTSMRGQWLTTALAALGALIGLAGVAAFWITGDSSPIVRAWAIPGGEFSVAMDGLSAIFLLPIFLVSLLGNIYGLGYWKQTEHPQNGRKLRLFYGTLTGSMAMLVVARNSILFLFGWEIMALSAFFLVTTESHKEEVANSRLDFPSGGPRGDFVSNCTVRPAPFGRGFVFAGPTCSRELDPCDGNGGFRPGASRIRTEGWHHAVACLVARFPRDCAQPRLSHHVGRHHQDGHLRSGSRHVVGTQSAAGLGSDRAGTGSNFGRLGGGLCHWSARLEATAGLPQHRKHRHHCHGSRPGACRPFVGRSEWIILGLSGALLHVWNHAFFKALLFLSAGSVIHATRTREIDQLGGLAKKMPWTSVGFLVGAVAICGLPPLNGFVSEFLIYLSSSKTLLDNDGATFAGAAFAVPALALIGALAVACFVKVYGAVFLGTGRSEHTVDAHESPPSMLVPMGVLVIACFSIGLAPRLLVPMLGQAVSAWAPSVADAGGRLGTLAPLGWISVTGMLLIASLLLTGAVLRLRLHANLVVTGHDLGLWLRQADCSHAIYFFVVCANAGRVIRLGTSSAHARTPRRVGVSNIHGFPQSMFWTRCSMKQCCRPSDSGPGYLLDFECFSGETSRPTCCTSSSY